MVANKTAKKTAKRIGLTAQQAVANEVVRLTPLADAIKDLPIGGRTRAAVLRIVELIASGQNTVSDFRWLAC